MGSHTKNNGALECSGPRESCCSCRDPQVRSATRVADLPFWEVRPSTQGRETTDLQVIRLSPASLPYLADSDHSCSPYVEAPWYNRASRSQATRKRQDLTFWLQGPITGKYQKSCVVGSLSLYTIYQIYTRYSSTI